MKPNTSDVKVEFVRTNGAGMSVFRMHIGSFVQFYASESMAHDSMVRIMIKEYNKNASIYQKITLMLSRIKMPKGTIVRTGYRWDMNMWEIEKKLIGIRYYVYSIFGEKDKRSIFSPKSRGTRKIAYGPTGNRRETI